MSGAQAMTMVCTIVCIVASVLNVIVLWQVAGLTRQLKKSRQNRLPQAQIETATGIEKRLADLQRMRFGPSMEPRNKEK